MKKDFLNLKKSRWLLLSLLAIIVGASPAWAQKALPYEYGFENFDLDSEGWTKYFGTSLTYNNNECKIVGDAKKTGSYGFRFSSFTTNGANAQYLISPELNAPNGVEVSFYYKVSNASGSEKFKVGYSTSDADVANFTWGDEISTNSTSWNLCENSFPAGTKYVAIYYYSNYQYRLYVDDFSFTAPITGPALAVADADDSNTAVNSGYNFDFGLATAGTTHYFILSNPGTESITLNIAATNGFGVSNNSLTLEAKKSSLLTVTMADATTSGTVTITPTASGVDPFVINISGTIRNPNKVYETLLAGSIPEEWTTSGTWSWSTTNGASNTANYESSNCRLITPKLTVAEGEKFYFDARGTYSGYQGVKFEYSADGTNWTASATTTTLTSDWQTFIINDIPAGSYYIALHGWQCNLRNFYGGQLPLNPTPKNLAYSTLTNTSAQLSWTSTATNFNIQYKADGAGDWTTIENVTVNPYILSGLTAVTTYQVKVQADHGVNGLSDYTDAISFTTKPDPISAYPYTETFNDLTSDQIPQYWDNSEGTTTTASYKWVYYATGHDGACLRFNSCSNSSGNTNMLKTPAMNFPSGKTMQLTFWYKNPVGGDFSVYISKDGGATYTTELATGLTGVSDWTKKEIVLPADFSENVVIVFQGISNWGSGDAYVYLDDVTIDEAPSCLKPNSLTIGNIESNSVTLNWTSDADHFNVQYKKVSDADWTDVSGTIDANSYTLPGLAPATDYQVRVRTYCDASDQSSWTDAVSFTTDCVAVTEFPFTENFNGITAGVPICWSNSEGTTTNGDYRWSYCETGHDGACLRFNSFSNSTNNTNFLKTPVMNFPTGKTMQLTFWYKNPTGGDFSLFISNDGGESYGKSLATGLTGTSAWTKEEIMLPAEYSENVVIVFKGTSNYGAGDAYLYLDDVTVEELPSCIKPKDLAVSNITVNSATLNWTSEADKWNIQYKKTADADWTTIENVTEKPYTLTGLSDLTDYSVRVQTNCGGGDCSEWTDAISFTTLQVAVSAENYTADFESTCDWLLVNGSQTNAWAWGSAVNNGGEKALYISNDGGTTNAYSTSGAESVAFAKKLFSFEDGAYTFAYDWSGNGESSYDYLRVALVPTTVELTAGTLPSGVSTNALPEGWIALDGGSELNQVTVWQHKSVELTLEAGQYNVVFIWRNDGGYGSNPAAAIDNFSVAKQACPLPTELAVSAIEAHEATLTWATTSNTWEVYITTTEETPATDVTVTASDISTNSYTFTGLKGETKYYVWVRSVSGTNKSEWAGTNFTTAISCFVPTSLTIASVASTSAVITWTKGSEDQTKWELSYSTTSGAPNEGTIVPLTETTYEMTGLTNGTAYYVYVRGVNSDDDKSQWSEVLEVIPGMFTVNNGTGTNEYVPVYGYYVDNLIRSQFIIPATTLTDIANSELSKMVFYCSNASIDFGSASFKVYMKEVANTSFTDVNLVDWSTLNEVYSGTLSVANGKMTIEFAEPIDYLGGNLMIGICQTAKGSYKNSTWYGVTTEGYTALGGYASSINRYKFLPQTSFYYKPMSNEAELAVSTNTIAFGKVHPTFAAEAKQMTFAIRNKGKAELKNICVSYTGDGAISVPTISGATIKAKDDAEYADINVTVTVNTENAGDFTGTITISATDQADAVINVSATVLDADKMFENFAGNALPEDWATQAIGSYAQNYPTSYYWSFTDGYASYKSAPTSSSSLDNYKHSLITPAMQFATGGEKLMFKMKKDKTQYGGDISNLLVQYTTDGTAWTDTEEGAWENAAITSDWTDAEVTIPETAKRVRFVATGIALDDIYGGKIVPEAKFEFTAADYNFGLITAEATTEAYTIQNPGSGDLTGLSVTSDNDKFVVAVADDATSIAARGSVTFTVTMKADVVGEQSGKITLNADGFEAKEFNVWGYVLDTDAILVDFAGNELPDGWTNSGFTLSDNEATRSGYAGSLTSSAVTVTDGQKMIIYARGRATGSASLTVKYSSDNGANWTEAKTFTTEIRKNTTDYVLLTVDNIAAGNYKLKFDGDNVTINTINGYAYDLSAPALGVTLAEASITTGYNDNFGAKVKEAMTHTYTIKNTGTGTLTGTITSSVPAHFTVSKSSFSLGAGESTTFDLSLVFNETYEDKASVITIHPTNDGLTDVVINASATTKDPNIWEEDFEDGIPAFWINEGGAWSTSRYNHEGQAGPYSETSKALITPRLQATEGQVLQFDVIDAENSTYFLKAEYSNDKSEWTVIDTYTTSGTKEFTAPADGYYYLRFTGYYTYVDNLEGFKLSLPDHIVDITSNTIPTSGLKEGVSFAALVAVKESRGLAEEVTAKLYMNDEVIGTETATVSANGSKTLFITCTPTVAAEDAEMYIEVTYAGGTLKSAKVTRDVAVAITLALDEEATDDVVAGTYDKVTITRSFVQGWNTLVLPIGIPVADLDENAVVYTFSSYSNDGELGFTKVTATTLDPATPYVVYVPTNKDVNLTYLNKTVYSTFVGSSNIYTRKYNSTQEATFQGTYTKMAAGSMEGKWGVTKQAKIAKGSSSASMKAFRAYFVLPEGSSARLAFFDEATGITRVIAAEELDQNAYNLKGQRVESLKKGNLYIKDGKKRVVK